MTMLEILRNNAAVRMSFNTWKVTDRKGWSIMVVRDPFYRDTEFRWKVDTQYFSHEKWAVNYLERIIQEKRTGIRVIDHPKRQVPNICGVNGSGCRSPGKCNTALCQDCPVAEEFFAKRDGVTLKYME